MPIAIWTVAVTILAMGMNTAQAAYLLSAQDWKTPGDNLATYDQSTGRYWLDVRLSKGMSYNSVLQELALGGSFEGFRVATYDEVVELVGHAGIIYSEDTPFMLNNPLAFAYSSFLFDLGFTSVSGNSSPPPPFFYTSTTYIIGMALSGSLPPLFGVPSILIERIDGWEIDAAGVAVRTHNGYYGLRDPSIATASVGTWLVKDGAPMTTTPEPATLSLAAFAGFGLTVAACRRRRLKVDLKLSQTSA